MSRSVRFVAPLAVVAAMALPCAQAATSYSFDVDYLGHNAGSVGAGSTSPEGTSLLAGDSFTYTLQAESGMLWEVTAPGNFFAMAALGAHETAHRQGDVTVTLSLGGSTVYSASEAGIQQDYVHIGGNYVPLTTGVKFDRLSFSYTLSSATGCDYDFVTNVCTPNGSTATTLSTLLPIFGGPESNGDGSIAYTGAVPEPGTLGQMMLGLLLVGALPRISRRWRTGEATTAKAA